MVVLSIQEFYIAKRATMQSLIELSVPSDRSRCVSPVLLQVDDAPLGARSFWE